MVPGPNVVHAAGQTMAPVGCSRPNSLEVMAGDSGPASNPRKLKERIIDILAEYRRRKEPGTEYDLEHLEAKELAADPLTDTRRKIRSQCNQSP